MPVRTITATAAVFIAALLFLCFRAAQGTPIYSARAGRTCDNCHLTPNGWENPDLSRRKCTLSCQSCHVDPAGGGMRNTSGRFYGRATVPMVATSPRPTSDWDRNFPHFGRRDKATTYSHNLPLGPDTYAESLAYADSVQDRLAWGTPVKAPSEYAFFPGRYGTLRSDPAFRVGWDVRFAALFAGAGLFFPMQVDIPVLVHPIEHFSLLINTGARGRNSGFSDTYDDSHSPYFRELFVLFHEAPYQSYLKAGRFVPSYGLRIDDHTSSIRRQLELDGALPESRVTGIEIGAAPNYPFVQASYFRMSAQNTTPDQWDIFDVDDGWGAAINGGYRNEGWTLAGSALMRRRPADEGGDTDTYGVYGVFNPWYYWRGVPLVAQAEFDVGNYQRSIGSQANQVVFYGEIDWLMYNGFNVLFAYDWADPDRDVVDDEWYRLQAGVQWTWYPGFTLDTRVRGLIPTAGGSDSDLFIQLHVWN